MDIKHMQYLVKIHEYQNITQAAKVLFVSPQALSKVIKNIEDEFQTEIIVRNGNRFSFSDFGKYLVTESEKMLNSYETFERNIANYRRLSKENILIACPINFSLIISDQIFNGFENTYPNYKLIINEYNDFHIDQHLLNNSTDIAFSVDDSINDELLIKHHILKSHFGVAISRKHPLANVTNLSIEDIAEYQIVTRNEDYKIFSKLENYAHKKGIALKYRLKTSDALAALTLIKDDSTLAIVLDVITPSPDYIFIPFKENIDWNLYLTVKKERAQETKISCFLKYFLASLNKLAE